MISKVKLICAKCGKEFERSKSEADRNAKRGRKTLCSLKCTGDITNIPSEKRSNADSLIANNKLDEFSPFRTVFSTSKRHAAEKGRDFTITLKNVKHLWEKQSGICPYTGWKLELPRTTKGIPISCRKASLDRKDSSKGYTPENIQFVSFMANCAKNKFPESDLITFCKAVAINHELVDI